MRARLTRFAIAILTTAAFAAAAQAQTSLCVNDAPNPYRRVPNWAQTSRPWAATNTVAVDARDNVWVFDRCEEAGCAASKVAPIWELSVDGKVMKNFGAGLFVFPHGIATDKDGNVWVADGNAKDGKGMQVTKLSPDGKILMTLGMAGQKGTGEDVFDQPSGVAVAPNGDIFVSEGHGPTFGNSRIMKFSKDGKFIKSFGKLGSGPGELKEPHAISTDTAGRVFVADRGNARVVIFDQDGKFVANWKQFGRPSGLWVDQKDMLYVADSQSTDTPGPNYNPGCKMGIRIGSVKDGKVTAFIPPPNPSSTLPPPEGIAVDSHGTIYAAGVQEKDVFKFVNR